MDYAAKHSKKKELIDLLQRACAESPPYVEPVKEKKPNLPPKAAVAAVSASNASQSSSSAPASAGPGKDVLGVIKNFFGFTGLQGSASAPKDEISSEAVVASSSNLSSDPSPSAEASPEHENECHVVASVSHSEPPSDSISSEPSAQNHLVQSMALQFLEQQEIRTLRARVVCFGSKPTFHLNFRPS